jgi:hypothetical protein
MNPELISGSVFRSNVVAVCAGENGRPLFPKVVLYLNQLHLRLVKLLMGFVVSSSIV